MVTLGLDISTTCVGYAFTENKQILDMGFIDIKKFKNHKEKAFFVLTEINKSSYIDKVEKVYVEDNLSGFAGGFTSQQTIVKLAKFNAVLCFVIEDASPVLPVKALDVAAVLKLSLIAISFAVGITLEALKIVKLFV